MELSFAQTLNEAKQVIVQQATRIKSDAEKLKALQEAIDSLKTTVSDQDRQIQDLRGKNDRQTAELAGITLRMNEAITAKEQADAVINRQGERITTLQQSCVELEKRTGEQSETIHNLTREKESLLERLPTQADTEALAALSSMLMKKVSGSKSSGNVPQMRLANAA